jgi:hypothetical protein
MKGMLAFKLPEEADEFKLACRGREYYSFIFELDNEMRNCLKHGHKFKTANEVMEYIRELIADVPMEDIT